MLAGLQLFPNLQQFLIVIFSHPGRVDTYPDMTETFILVEHGLDFPGIDKSGKVVVHIKGNTPDQLLSTVICLIWSGHLAQSISKRYEKLPQSRISPVNPFLSPSHLICFISSPVRYRFLPIRCVYNTILTAARSRSIYVKFGGPGMETALETAPEGRVEICEGPGSAASGQMTGYGAVQGWTEEDLYVLAHVICGEAQNCPDDEQRYIGSVVLNRRNSGRYPGTIKGVVFQPGQYSCTRDGN